MIKSLEVFIPSACEDMGKQNTGWESTSRTQAGGIYPDFNHKSLAQ